MTEDNVLAGKLLEKIGKKNIFLHPYSHWRKESNPEFDPEPDLLVRGTDPRIRNQIHTRMLRIPNIRQMFFFTQKYQQ